jgi:hypothetical protein
MGMINDSPKPILVGTLTFKTWFEMFPDSVRFARSDQKVAIFSEFTQTFFLPDVSLAHLALDCSDAAQTIFRISIIAGFAKRKEDCDVAFANCIPDILSADPPGQLASQLSHAAE